MKFLSKTATAIFKALVAMQEESGGSHLKIDNAAGVYQYVSFERLCEVDFCGSRAINYSVAHYRKMGGDLVPDPDMTFYAFTVNGELVVVPASFQNQLTYREGIFRDKDGWKVRKNEQAGEVDFANTWLKNIKAQQGLEVAAV